MLKILLIYTLTSLSTYYGHIVQFGEEIFPSVKKNIIKMILIKSADFLFVRHQKMEHTMIEESPHSVSE